MLRHYYCSHSLIKMTDLPQRVAPHQPERYTGGARCSVAPASGGSQGVQEEREITPDVAGDEKVLTHVLVSIFP